jgi:arylsulfatase A-like enzyme
VGVDQPNRVNHRISLHADPLKSRHERVIGGWRALVRAAASVVCLSCGAHGHPPAMVVIAVFDGLRPDAITPVATPTLARLQREGVRFVDTHAAYPTVTRVNGAALQTGSYPGENGLVSNTLFVPALDSTGALSTADAATLLRIDAASGGHLVDRPMLSERLAAAGVSYAAVSTGSTGNALMQNLRAPTLGGVLVDSGFGDGRVAYPTWLSDSILVRVGPSPGVDSGGAVVGIVNWVGRALRQVVLPVVRPRVLVYWMTEPDQSEHVYGLGSPEALAALRAADRNLQLLLDALGSRLDSTDFLIVSDHGFAHGVERVNVVQALVAAGLKQSLTSADVVVGDDGHGVHFYVRGHDSTRVAAIAQWAEGQPWADVVFTRGSPGRTEGSVPGTVSLEVVRLQHATRGPDVVVTLPWWSDTNAAGIRGTAAVVASSAAAGPTVAAITTGGDTHGGLSPYTVRSTMIAWGPDFRQGTVDSLPVGNVDVAPTVLALLGLGVPRGAMDGRVLTEAFRGGPAVSASVVFDTIDVRAGPGYEARVARRRLGDWWYVDAGWRVR